MYNSEVDIKAYNALKTLELYCVFDRKGNLNWNPAGPMLSIENLSNLELVQKSVMIASKLNCRHLVAETVIKK